MANKSTDAPKHVSPQKRKTVNVVPSADSATLLQRAQDDPQSLTAKEIRKLHTIVGNRAVQRILADSRGQRRADESVQTMRQDGIIQRGGGDLRNSLKDGEWNYELSAEHKELILAFLKRIKDRLWQYAEGTGTKLDASADDIQREFVGSFPQGLPPRLHALLQKAVKVSQQAIKTVAQEAKIDLTPDQKEEMAAVEKNQGELGNDYAKSREQMNRRNELRKKNPIKILDSQFAKSAARSQAKASGALERRKVYNQEALALERRYGDDVRRQRRECVTRATNNHEYLGAWNALYEELLDTEVSDGTETKVVLTSADLKVVNSNEDRSIQETITLYLEQYLNPRLFESEHRI